MNYNDLNFFELFELLVSKMTQIDMPQDTDSIQQIVGVLAQRLGLSKGVTRIYRNPREEQQGGGETLIAYDNGLPGKLVHSVRIVTSVMSIVTVEAYVHENADPIPEDKFAHLDLVMRTVASYVSRNRLKDLVNELAFFDDAGYKNLRSLQFALMEMGRNNAFQGKAVLHYNLRHFTLVNQQVGTLTGDEVMRNHYDGLAKLIGDEGCVYRLGGDNFVAYCSADQLERVLEYLRKTNVPYFPGGTIVVRANVGVFVIPQGFEFHGLGDIMEKIMTASRAAQTGMSWVVYFDKDLMHHKESADLVQERFPGALRNEEFRVFYQPKVNINTGKLSGAEALCRWFRQGEMVPPAAFIPILEQTNDICKLDFYMLDHVCQDISRWLREGKNVVRVSVNMSRRHMTDPDFLKTVFGIIDKHSVPHELLEIELTETTTDVEFKDMKRVVSGIHEAGIYTSIDDFGVGYSSINLIRGVPWNVLKIDRSFLPINSTPDQTSSVIFRYVVGMSKEIGLECVAEGVETPEHLQILKENGCDLAQGYLFDRPLPVEVFEKRLEQGSYPV